MVGAGIDCTDRTSFVSFSSTVYTIIHDTPYRFTSSGKITSWCVYSQGSSSMRLKVFRDDGTDWIYVGQTSLQSIVAGLNSFSGEDIDVLDGDYLAVTVYSAVQIEAEPSYITEWHRTGDITSTTPKSEWNDSTIYQMSIKATITVLLTDVYVNSSTGNDTYVGDSCVAGHPVLTFAKAYSLLASGGTIHICNSGADFSAETITLNKSYNTDLNGADGYWYGPQGS